MSRLMDKFKQEAVEFTREDLGTMGELIEMLDRAEVPVQDGIVARAEVVWEKVRRMVE